MASRGVLDRVSSWLGISIYRLKIGLSFWLEDSELEAAVSYTQCNIYEFAVLHNSPGAELGQ